MIRNTAVKALITAAAMMVVALVIDQYFRNQARSLQYLAYLVYAAGIAWVMIPPAHASRQSLGFGQLFSTGFRCFVLVTLLMVVFTWLFMKMRPEIKSESLTEIRKELSRQPDLTPDDAEKNMNRAIKYYDVMMVSMAIFGYLSTGALITVLLALGITVFRKKVEMPPLASDEQRAFKSDK